MNLYKSLRVEGTSRYELLVYLLFPIHCIATASDACHSRFSGEGHEVTQLLSDDWPCGIVLVEIALYDEREIARQIVESLHAAFDVEHCLASLCLFDGAFYSHDDIFSAALAEQTYAFCTEPKSANLCISEGIRASEEWELIVQAQRRAITEG